MKMRKVHCKTWNMVRNKKKREKVQNEKCTLKNLEYGEKGSIMENEKHGVYDVKYSEKQ
jgi:hypothetical protein